MKGGNWVPADMIYSNVDKKHLEKLVDLAIGANFNILRIWGGANLPATTYWISAMKRPGGLA